MSESESERRRRLINLGELIALAALIVSAIGVWVSWRSASSHEQPTRIVEQRPSIPLTLRAKAEDDGQKLDISPVEPTHALESLTVSVPGAAAIQIGSDGELDSSDLESQLKGHDKEPKDKTLSIRVYIDAHYVEAGKDRRGGGSYVLRYKWVGGGLFGGRSLKLVSLSRG